MCFWINEVLCISNTTEHFFILHVDLQISWTMFPRAMDRTLRSPPLASQVSRLKPTGLLCIGIDERTSLQWEVGNAKCIARSHSWHRWPQQKQPAEAATCYPRDPQPSGSLSCGRRWHYRKSTLSSDKFKLKVISRS